MKKSLKHILGVLVLMIVVLLIPNNVNAEEMSDEFKSIINAENKIVIKDSSISNSKQELLDNYLSKITYSDGSWVGYNICNEDYSSCDIVINRPNGDGEVHTISIEYKEEISNNFKKVLTNGKLEINSTSFDDKSGLIYQALDKKATDALHFSYESCDENFTKCNIQMFDNSSFTPIETHAIEINYNEKFSDRFIKLLTDGVFKFKTIKPTSYEHDFMLWNYVDTFTTDKYYVYFSGCDEKYTKCEITIDENGLMERHIVKVSFEEEDKIIKNKVDNYIKKVDSLKVDDGNGWKSFIFELIDLEMVNYYATTKSKDFNYEKMNELFPYSQTLKKISEGANYSYRYNVGMGSDEPFSSYVEGGVSVIYNNIHYGVIDNTGVIAKNVLYIPSDTEKTPEAFIKAALKKINDYLPDLKVKITKSSTFEEYVFSNGYEEYTDIEDYIEDFIDVKKTVGNVFVIDFGGFKVDFLIVADSEKVIKPEFVANDIETNISVTSTSSSIPLDTKVEVEKLSSGSEYEKIIKILDVEYNEMYDIKLYSSAKAEYITKLDNGKFEVKIPVSKQLKDKTLVAYYVDENNNIKEYDAPVTKDGYAVFETDHFSIYTLAEKKIKDNTEIGTSEVIPEVPETFDGITSYTLIGFISLICLLKTGYMFKKENK